MAAANGHVSVRTNAPPCPPQMQNAVLQTKLLEINLITNPPVSAKHCMLGGRERPGTAWRSAAYKGPAVLEVFLVGRTLGPAQ